MSRRRLHRWVKGGKDKAGKERPDFCTMCGVDRSPASEREGCRPTQLF